MTTDDNGEQRSDVCSMTALQLVAAFTAGELSPSEVTDSVLSAIDRVDGHINAFCHRDDEAARSSARAATQRYLEGTPLSALDGVPTSIKDVFLTAGTPTFRGSRLLAGKAGANESQSWAEDAPVTAASVGAGCVVVGKTTTPEFAWKGVTDSPLTGITRNPHDPALTAGGSSGGAAAAVAAGLGPLAVGTDGGGSVRIPAAFCGIVALKPSYGVIPLYPSSPFGTLAHAGPMTRTVCDTAALMDVLIRPDCRDWSAVPPITTTARGSYLNAAHDGYQQAEQGAAPLTGVKVAYSPTLGFGTNDPEIESSVSRAVQVLADLGAEVTAIELALQDPAEAFHVMWFAGVEAVLAAHGNEARSNIDPSLRSALERHHGYSAGDYLEAVAARMSLGSTMGRLHQTYDLLVTPTMPIPAFAAGSDVPPNWHSPDWTSWTPYTYPFNLTQQPALSIPCGVTASKLPVGIQLVGARFADRAVVRAGAALEAALKNVGCSAAQPRIHASEALTLSQAHSHAESAPL